MKLTVLASLLLVLTSCTSYRTIAKKENITKDFLSQLRINKRYKFDLATGSVLRIRIDSIDREKLYGRVFESGDVFVSENTFSDSLENMNVTVTKISRRKFNPFLTLLAVGVPVGIFGISTLPFGGFGSIP